MTLPSLFGRASALALALCAGGAAAQTTVSGVTVKGEVVTTAPVAPPLATAFTESTVTADTLRNISPAPSITVQTMLNDQPSIFAYANGPLGTGTTINFRAFNSGQFAETYQGVALNDLFNGGVTNQASVVNNVLLLPSNVDSVEIFRGINNPSVNSYNSLGGTINYLPRQPSQTASGEVGASYGSFDTVEFHALGNTGEIAGTRQLLAVDQASSNGWFGHTPDRNTNVYYSGAYDAPGGDHLGLVLVYDHNLGYSPLQTPLPLLQQNGNFYSYPTNQSYENDRNTDFLAIFDFRAQLASNVTFDSKVFGGTNDYKRTSYANPAYDQSATQIYQLPNQSSGYPFWLDYPTPVTYDPVATFGDAHAGTDYHFYGYSTWGLGYTPTLTVSLPHNTVTVGGNITYGELHSREYWYGSYAMPMQVGYNDAWDERDSRLLASAYLQDEAKLFNDRLTVTAGVKYIYASTTDNDSLGFYYPYPASPHDTEDYISPTAAVNFKIIDDLAVYAAFGQNVKFPDITAYYNNIPTNTSNPPPAIPPVTIKPEYVNDYEAGVRYQHGGFAGSVSYYREDFTNTFIDAYNSNSGFTQVSNGGSSRYQGVEVRLTADLGERPWGDLKGYVNYAYNQAIFTSSFISDYVGGSNSNAGVLVTNGEPLADVPANLFSFGGSWSWSGWRADVQGRYVGSQYTDQLGSGTTSTTQIGSFFVLDLGVSKTLAIKPLGAFGRSVKLSFNANNLTNAYYFNTAYTQQDYNYNNYLAVSPAAPRSFVGSVQVNF